MPAPDNASRGPVERVHTKQQWRDLLLAERRALPAAVREAEAGRLAGAVTDFARVGDTVCAYVPIGHEPGSMAMLDALRAAGARVLLPVARADEPLDWAEFTGEADLVDAAFGLREPGGAGLGHAVVDSAATILLPALAVDRRGVRLGRGAGFYDRTLATAGRAARLVAVVRDAEFVEQLPEEPHDRRVGWVLTPGRGAVRL